MGFDISHASSPFPLRNKLGRVAWSLVWGLLFRPSPRLLYGWRRFLLRTFRARVGRGARIDSSVRVWAPWNLKIGDHSTIGHHVDCYSVARISIGSNAIVSQYCFLCTGTHNYRSETFAATSSPIEIGDGVWVAADVFVGPGVRIGDGAVVGARASVFEAVEAWTVVGGTPASLIKRRERPVP